MHVYVVVLHILAAHYQRRRCNLKVGVRFSAGKLYLYASHFSIESAIEYHCALKDDRADSYIDPGPPLGSVSNNELVKYDRLCHEDY